MREADSAAYSWIQSRTIGKGLKRVDLERGAVQLEQIWQIDQA